MPQFMRKQESEVILARLAKLAEELRTPSQKPALFKAQKAAA